ncbi:MAG: prohibitin family protein [Betaproteobacteria bacterium]|nr:MAG: prohibitin family protein [Betaproteobacteria bacterium]
MADNEALRLRAGPVLTNIGSPGSLRRVALGAAAVLVLLVLSSSFFTVQQYERAVVTTWGRYSHTAEPGLNWKVPLVQSAHPIRTDIRTLTPTDAKGVNTYTVDNQEVDIYFNVFYRVPPKNVPFIYENAQDYKERLFNIAVDRLKSEMGKVSVAHVAEQRGAIRDRIKKVMSNDAAVLGVDVTDFQLTNIEYTKGFKSAVEQAVTARQMIETREREAAQEKQVAERNRIKAQGEADALLTRAQAEAKSIQLRGEAEAAAIQAQAEALRQNTGLVELRKAEKWNGALPQQLLSGVVPFMQFNAPAPK